MLGDIFDHGFSHQVIHALGRGLSIASGDAAGGSSLLFYFALVPALGIAAQWIAWKTRLPGILLLLVFGILLGRAIGSPEDVISSATGSDAITGTRILFPLVSLSVAVILFEGGLSLRIAELKEAGSAVLRLVTIAALITMLLTTLAAKIFLGFETQMALLVGAILVVTGPTVISPLLRQIRPSRRVESTLKWEGIVIDPIGAVLAVLVFEVMTAVDLSETPFWVVGQLVKTTLAGVVMGGAGALAIMQAYRRYWVPDYLQGIMALVAVLGLFSLSNYFAEESGLITVTVLGMILANQKAAAIDHVIELKEHLRTFLIACLFILLGSRIELASVSQLGWGGVAFVVVLILVVRPVAVFTALWRTQLNLSEKIFVSSMAPRGIVAAAVASVFALKLEGLGAEGGAATGSSELVVVTFLAILSTVTVYGLASGQIARSLGLAQPNPQGILFAGADHWVRELAKVLHENDVQVLLVDTNYNKISAARMAGLPAECVNVLSDHALEEINFGGIGRLLAVTPNDEVNSLAVQEFRHLFTRAGAYQLSFRVKTSAHKRLVASHLRGRILFGEEWTFTHFREVVEAGAIFKATKLTESFGFEDFRERYGDATVLLFVVSDDDVLISAVDAKLSPKPGDTLISLVPAIPIPTSHAASPDGDDERSTKTQA